MKCVVLILAILFCVSHCGLTVDGAMYQFSPHPSRQAGGCYDEKSGHLRAGDKVPVVGECFSIKCNDDGSMTGMSCGTAFSKNPRCLVTRDLSKPYPDCCPTIQC